MTRYDALFASDRYLCISLKIARRQTDLPRDSVDYFNDEEYWNIPQELQEEVLPLDDVDLAPAEDQPHNATMGPQGHDTLHFDFDFNQSFSPGPEPGPLDDSRHHRVFTVGPDNESEEEQEGEEDLWEPEYESEDCND